MQYQVVDITKLKVVAFDWDNTLAMTRGALVKAVNVVLSEYGLPQWDEVKKIRNPEWSFQDNFPLIFKQDFQKAYHKYCQYYKEIAPRMITRPDKALDVIQYLREIGVKVVIVTNKDRNLLEFDLPLLYDFSMFDKIVCGHEAQKDKPNPEQLIYAVQDFTDVILPETVWMVGDSQMDSKCALHAGAKAIRIGSAIWDMAEIQDQRIWYLENFQVLYHEMKAR